jgi:hypothetical protein
MRPYVLKNFLKNTLAECFLKALAPDSTVHLPEIQLHTFDLSFALQTRAAT